MPLNPDAHGTWKKEQYFQRFSGGRVMGPSHHNQLPLAACSMCILSATNSLSQTPHRVPDTFHLGADLIVLRGVTLHLLSRQVILSLAQLILQIT